MAIRELTYRIKLSRKVPVVKIVASKGPKGDPGDPGGPQGEPGEDGYSPTIAVSKSNGTTTLTITDVDGTRQAFINDGADGADGADGYSPSASVTQTANGATISITDKNGTTTANLTNGATGADGYSPSASVTQTANGATISITDKNGTTTANIANGAGISSTTFASYFGFSLDTIATPQSPQTITQQNYNAVANYYTNLVSINTRIIAELSITDQYGTNAIKGDISSITLSQSSEGDTYILYSDLFWIYVWEDNSTYYYAIQAIS